MSYRFSRFCTVDILNNFTVQELKKSLVCHPNQFSQYQTESDRRQQTIRHEQVYVSTNNSDFSKKYNIYCVNM